MWPSRPAADRSGVRPSRTTRLPAPAPASTTAGRCARTAWAAARLSRPHSRPCWWARPADRRSAPRPGARARTGVPAAPATGQREAHAVRLRPVAQDGGVQRLARQRDVGARRRRRGARPRHMARWCCRGRCRRTGTRRPAPCRSRRTLPAPRPRPAPPGWRPAAPRRPPPERAGAQQESAPAGIGMSCRSHFCTRYSGEAATSTMAARTRSRGRSGGMSRSASRSVAPSPR